MFKALDLPAAPGGRRLRFALRVLGLLDNANEVRPELEAPSLHGPEPCEVLPGPRVGIAREEGGDELGEGGEQQPEPVVGKASVHHDKSPAGAQDLPGAVENAGPVRQHGVGQAEKHGVRGGVECQPGGVAEAELDISQASATDKAPSAVEHAGGGVEADDVTVAADRVIEQSQVAPRAAADLEHGVAGTDAERTDGAAAHSGRQGDRGLGQPVETGQPVVASANGGEGWAAE
jgi:hypothetical protein